MVAPLTKAARDALRHFARSLNRTVIGRGAAALEMDAEAVRDLCAAGILEEITYAGSLAFELTTLGAVVLGNLFTDGEPHDELTYYVALAKLLLKGGR